MNQQGFDGRARPEFWLEHVRAGVVASEVAGLLVVVYVVVDPTVTNRPALLALAGGLMAGTAVILLLPMRRILAHPAVGWFFYAWSGTAWAVITAGAVLSGGSQSPIPVFYFLLLVYAATAYPPEALVRISLLTVGAYLAMAMYDTRSFGISAMVAGALALTAWMSSITARIQWTQLQEQTALAREDGLTGCLNQRAFREVLETEVDRAQRFGHPLGLVLVDLDEFKAVNDRRGHLAGDAVLANVGAMLRDMVRSIDAVGRIGGDEFALLLIETGPSQALHVGRRVCERARATAGSTTTTVSVGVASLQRSSSPTMLLADADVALYAAKRAGRDTVRSVDDDPT